MRQDVSRNDGLNVVDDSRSWDCFVGPAVFMQDDRYSAGFMPLVMAAKTMAFAAEINARMIEGMVASQRKI